MASGRIWTGLTGISEIFISAEVTGDGSEQSTAHGLKSTPVLALAVFSELTGGADDIAEGTHDATNVNFTVTSGAKYKVIAFA